MSQRDIADAVGVSKSQTADRDRAGVPNGTPGKSKTTGHDGKTYNRPKSKPKASQQNTDPRARVRPRSEFWACTPEGFPGAYKMLTGGIKSILDNPTLEQVHKLQGLMKRTLAKLDKIEAEIIQVNQGKARATK